jgi:hypothetical protein
MRVRKVITRSGRGIRGKFPSRKLGKQVYWESTLERDAILLFEMHPLVLSYQEQPLLDTYYDEERLPHDCYPDFLIRTIDGREVLVEIKYHNDLNRPDTRRRLALIAMHYTELGKSYRVITEKVIRREPLLGNLQRLWEASRVFQVSSHARYMLKNLDAQRVYTVASLAGTLGGEAAVMALIATGRLRANLDEPLTSSARVWTPLNREAGDGSFSI